MAFFLFLLVNAVLYTRPMEVVPDLQDVPLYNGLILACLACAVPGVLEQFLAGSLRGRPVTVFVLGLQAAAFPNLFFITGPGSPSVFSNMVRSIEQHVEFVADLLVALRERGASTVEPTPVAEADWVKHVNDVAGQTLMLRTASWYMGANIPGKPRVFTSYLAGCGTYRARCDAVASAGYEGFALGTS